MDAALKMLSLQLRLRSWGKRSDLSFHLYILYHEKKNPHFNGCTNHFLGYLRDTAGEFWRSRNSFVPLTAAGAGGKTSTNAVICHFFQAIASWPTSLPVPRHQEMRQDTCSKVSHSRLVFKKHFEHLGFTNRPLRLSSRLFFQVASLSFWFLHKVLLAFLLGNSHVFLVFWLKGFHEKKPTGIQVL